jgi:hypothetical protein
MPFYLVIQTTLIEADNEHAAARKGVDLIRSGGKVAVTVKADETTLTHIVIPAKPDDRTGAAPRDPDIHAPREQLPSLPVDTSLSDKKAVLKRMMLDVRLLMRWRR